MKKQAVIKISGGIIAFILLLGLIIELLVEPLAGRKLEKKINDKFSDYHIKITDVDISIIRPGIKLSDIEIYSKKEASSDHDFKGTISFINVTGIDLWNAIIRKKVDIREIVVRNSALQGKITFNQDTATVKTAPAYIQIGRIIFDGIDFTIGNTSDALAILVKNGSLHLSEMNLEPDDTITSGIFKQIELKASMVSVVTADSLYTFTVNGLINPADGTTTADSFSIQPNYPDYEFAARNKFETDRIEAKLSNLLIHDFSTAGFLAAGDLQSTYIEIGELKVEAFRDKRKKIRKADTPMFQDMIKNYPGKLRIDSVGIHDGDVTYIEHAQEASKAGSIQFNHLNAKIYNINNVDNHQHDEAAFRLRARAKLMGVSRLSVVLKAGLSDKNNPFSVNGNLEKMNVDALNPILVNNAFILPNSGQIDAMNFSFTANKYRATGTVTLLYHGLNVAVVDKKTHSKDDLPEQFMSFFANLKILDSNPLPGREIRTGKIEYERDPERFLFNYVFKSILTGIKSNITETEKHPKKKRR